MKLILHIIKIKIRLKKNKIEKNKLDLNNIIPLYLENTILLSHDRRYC